jgi:hypothetical protein
MQSSLEMSADFVMGVWCAEIEILLPVTNSDDESQEGRGSDAGHVVVGMCACPCTLKPSKDECKFVLRELELDTYWRAAGVLDLYFDCFNSGVLDAEVSLSRLILLRGPASRVLSTDLSESS